MLEFLVMFKSVIVVDNFDVVNVVYEVNFVDVL